jgi:hypothetical protein
MLDIANALVDPPEHFRIFILSTWTLPKTYLTRPKIAEDLATLPRSYSLCPNIAKNLFNPPEFILSTRTLPMT